MEVARRLEGRRFERREGICGRPGPAEDAGRGEEGG